MLQPRMLPGMATAVGFEDRRKSMRFPIERTIRCDEEGRTSQPGMTLDMSSSGVLVALKDPPIPGQSVKLVVDWPVRLRGTTHLQLIIQGRVVRRGPHKAAVRVMEHEFRTLRSGGLFSRTGA
jgi:hypothetical protein